MKSIFYRIVNLEEGSITIDGYDISDIGLDVLRGRLALVPQDSTLFLGTLRENLWVSVLGNLESSYQNPNARDPQATRTDAELISVLRRAWLLPQEGVPIDPVTETKFSLDASVNDEGVFGTQRIFPKFG